MDLVRHFFHAGKYPEKEIQLIIKQIKKGLKLNQATGKFRTIVVPVPI